MKVYIKYFVLLLVSFLAGIIISHFSKTISFYEASTLMISSIALLRTCEQED